MKNSILSNQKQSKWLAIPLALLLVYGLLQPTLVKQFGLPLPSIGNLSDAGNSNASKSTATDSQADGEIGSQSRGRPSNAAASSATHEIARDTELPFSTQETQLNLSKSAPKNSSESTSSADSADNKNTTKATDPLSYLQTIGNQTYRSPEGLIYRRGSAEGHRLKHIERHLENDADRPGSHGVFEGTMVEFLEAIDQTYKRAKRKEKGTKSYTDEGRTIYEASFANTLGYLGGEQGKRRNHPKLKRIRLVVDGEAVITAFPF